MDDRYFFDKRVMKKAFIKYGLIFLFTIPVILFFNYFLNQTLKFWLVVVIDTVFLLLVVFVVQLIINAIAKHRLENPKQQKPKKDKNEIVVEIEEADKKPKKSKPTVIKKNKD